MLRKNRKKKIILVFGTRPEAIKMAPIIKELQKHREYFKTIICITAQHREILEEVLGLFAIKPDYDLNVMQDNQSLFDVTTKILLKIKKVLETERPDLVMVQGDTTTTFSSSLASFYLKIPLAHIEAGLRTTDKYQPFPEEINRRLTSHLADLHFVPTKQAKENLIKEGISEKFIFLTGNTVVDSLFYILREIKKRKIKDKFSFLNSNRKLILVTAHRRENFGKPLKNICLALKKIVERNKDIEIVYPVHPNPNVYNVVTNILKNTERIHLIRPLDYFSFVYLMSKSYLILTDSGGIQEEAPSLRKPILIMREKTERPEVIESGAAKLAGTDVNYIVKNSERLLRNKNYYQKMSSAINPFGDGRAAQRIIRILRNLFKHK